MWHLDGITPIEYRRGYIYHIAFDDGREGDVDPFEYVGKGPVFEPLRDSAFFRSARIHGETISWPNGADIAPETLSEKIEAAKKTLQRTAFRRR